MRLNIKTVLRILVNTFVLIVARNLNIPADWIVMSRTHIKNSRATNVPSAESGSLTGNDISVNSQILCHFLQKGFTFFNFQHKVERTQMDSRRPQALQMLVL